MLFAGREYVTIDLPEPAASDVAVEISDPAEQPTVLYSVTVATSDNVMVTVGVLL